MLHPLRARKIAGLALKSFCDAPALNSAPVGELIGAALTSPSRESKGHPSGSNTWAPRHATRARYLEDVVGRPDLKSDKSIASPIALYPASFGCR